MNAIVIDTLAFSKKLRAEFTPAQAEALAEAFVAGIDEQLATKADLREMEQHLDSRLVEIEAKLDTRLAGVDVKLAQVEAKVDTRFAQVDTRFAQMETQIAASANKMIIWVIGAMFALSALVVGLVRLG